MGIFSYNMGKQTGGIVTLQTTSAELGTRLAELHIDPTFIVGFVSPHVDIDQIARVSRCRFPAFEVTDIRFNVLSSSPEQRYVNQVFDQKGRVATLVKALCQSLHCDPTALETKLAEYSFAIQVGKELYVRSISRVDLESGRVHFLCDIAPGEELVMVRRTGLVTTSQRDFKRFMEGKPGLPVAGILNDCILRRLYNEGELAAMGKVLEGIPSAGFSTFGEILGLNLNQTLTAIFFFRVAAGVPFRDEYTDNFVAHYGEFKAFFLRRQVAKLTGLSRVVVQQIEDFEAQRFDRRFEVSGLEDCMARVFSGLNELGQVLKKSHELREDTAHQLENCASELYRSVDALSAHIGDQGTVVTETGETVSRLTGRANEAASSARGLADASSQIQTVVEVIQQIAGQTNLLALNAAIEAARAGEYGRGFAVVADEVRKLANKSRNSAIDIGRDISHLASEISSVAKEIEDQSEGVADLAKLLAAIQVSSQRTAETAGHTKAVADTLKELTPVQISMA